jgi:hypothetical protein
MLGFALVLSLHLFGREMLIVQWPLPIWLVLGIVKNLIVSLLRELRRIMLALKFVSHIVSIFY